MALDTAEKRQSAAGCHRKWTRAPGVTPNAAMDQEWRLAVAQLYMGNALAAPAPGYSSNEPAFGRVRQMRVATGERGVD